MTQVSTLDPSQREVLVNVGNRYVIFGPPAGLPRSTSFDANTDQEVLPRVADEDEVAEARIAQTLRVAGMERAAAEGVPKADVELLDDVGNRVLIDVKVRERDPKQRDLAQSIQRLKEAASNGERLEVWYFNIERLKLLVMRLETSGLQIDQLTPLDVWEKTAEGVFSRAQVVAEVDDWVRRVGALYDEVRAWLSDRPELRCEQNRAVTMSEELMQKYAVPDREIPVLDVLEANQVIASFVPRGLWMIGSWGRVDVITPDRTQMLVALGGEGNLEWRLVSREGRRQTRSFDKDAFLTLINQP